MNIINIVFSAIVITSAIIFNIFPLKSSYEKDVIMISADSLFNIDSLQIQLKEYKNND